MTEQIDFRTRPEDYKHWKLSIDGNVAHLDMSVDPEGGLFEGYELKLNSYDLGVDIELYDATQRLRFEHPRSGEPCEFEAPVPADLRSLLESLERYD